jgi:hypothetical protein
LHGLKKMPAVYRLPESPGIIDVARFAQWDPLREIDQA